MSMHFHTRRVPLTLALFTFVAAGCAKSESAAGDSAAMAAPASATAADTGMAGMAGMDHSSMAGMNRPAAKDADQEFLRMMTDHHEGMVMMGTDAMTKGSTPAIQGDAHMMHTKQVEEQKKMIGMVQAMHGETLTPMVMPSNKAMMDDLATKSGADYDKAFYTHVIAHHKEAVKMVDDMSPKLANAELKQMALKMKADQTKEIARLAPKAK